MITMCAGMMNIDGVPQSCGISFSQLMSEMSDNNNPAMYKS